MKVHIITIFPEYFEYPLKVGPIKKAIEAGSLIVEIVDLKNFADSPKEIDDYPYGGGPGMVMKPEPIKRALDSIQGIDKAFVILLSPQGELLNQKLVKKLAQKEHIVLICGRYKGIDERVKNWINMELSIGDYVLSGGEPAALVVLDTVARWLPGALGDKDSAETDSFENGLLEAPLYTRPREFEGLKVPDVLLSGDHKKIALWKRKMALKKTLIQRPDLLKKAKLSEEDIKLLEEIKQELENEKQGL